MSEALLEWLGFLPLLLAGATLLVLAALVFVSRPDRGINRAFAVFLLCQGFFFLLLGLESRVDSVPGRLRQYAIIALPFAALYLAFHLLMCYRALRPSRTMRIAALSALLALAATFETLFVVARELYLVPTGEPGSYASGPLDYGAELALLLFGALSVLFAMALRASRLGVARKSLGQAMAAFGVVPVYIAAWALAASLVDATAGDGWAAAFGSLFPWGLVPGGLVAALGLVILRRSSDATVRDAGRTRGWIYTLVAGTGILSGTIFGFGQAVPAFRDAFPSYYLIHFLVYGLWALTGALMLAVPVLRDHILDVEFKAQLTLRNGFIATVGGGAVLAGVQVGANLLSQEAGFTFGGLAAVLLLVMLGPVAHAGERLAKRALASPGPIKALDHDARVRLFAEQAELAWADGQINRKERHFLDRLAQRLGLGLDEMERIERASLGR